MKAENGTDYAHNYDFIVKWMAAVLRGQTLEVLGVKSGRIEEVFGFEPAEIAVRAGRVDVMVRDDTGAVYHMEEQRNLRKADMHRFAAYHFLGAGQWGDRLTDIIVASGEVYAGSKVIRTESGEYSPIVIDFSQRDGAARLREIRSAVEAESFSNWLELIFVPLYGKETGSARAELAESVLRFETELHRTGRISATVLVATLILSNKLIDKTRLQQIWEEIKMLDIFEIAKEEGFKEGKVLGIKEGKSLGIEEGKSLGIEEGKSLGIEEGKVLAMQEMVLDALIEAFSVVPGHVSERIRSIRNMDVLKGLHRQALRCKDIRAFEAVLNQVD